jgi:hypothetical protein
MESMAILPDNRLVSLHGSSTFSIMFTLHSRADATIAAWSAQTLTLAAIGMLLLK